MNGDTLKQSIVRVMNRHRSTIGTGSLISTDGHILTCWHVIDANEYLRVQFEGEENPVQAELCLDLSNRDLDVAVLRMARPPQRTPVELDVDWRIGDDVWSYGYQYQNYFSSGYPISGKLSGDTSIQEQQLIVVSNTDIQRGLSGAPLLNLRTGKVFALVNAKFDDRGIGFAIPIATARRRWSGLESITVDNGDRLRENTADLFRAMGYQIDGRRRPAAGNTSAFFADLSVGVGLIRTVVGCIDGNRSGHERDIEQAAYTLVSLKDRERLDRALLVTSNEYSAPVRATAESLGVQLLTYRELEGRLIDFSPYLDAVVNDFENFNRFADFNRVPVIEQFRWCDLYHYFIDLGCLDPRADTEYPSARTVFKDFLRDEAQNHVSFLGDYGTGKTTLCLRLTYELARENLQDPFNTRIPLFIPLRNLDVRNGVRRLILDTLADYGVRVADPAALDIMMRSGRFVLILDGFDEAVDHLDRRGMMQVFSQISHLTSARAKVVLTCRTHYFRTENQGYAALTPKTMTPLMREVHQRPNFRILELMKFDEPRILDLLSRHSPNYREQWRTMQGIYNLADLARTPILANIMVNSLEELLALRSRNEVDSAALYDVYTKYWLERDDGRSDATTQDRSLFAEELAWRMYRDDRLAVPHEELAVAVAGFFSDSHRYTADWLEKLDTNIRTCSFLARDRRGAYLFAHKSFMEFFVAKALVRRLDEWSHLDLWPRAVPYEIASFVSELLPSDDIARLKRMSVDRENNDFLRGLCMDVQMNRGDTIKDEPIIFAIAVSPDGRHVATANGDCRVRIFTEGLEPIAQLSEHREWARCVAYSGDNRFFASGGWDNLVIVRSVPNYEVHLELRMPERVNAVCFNRDSSKILCGGYDRTVSVWDLRTGELLDSLSGHADSIQGIVLDPSNGNAISASTDRTIMVWPLESPGATVRVEAQDEPIRCVAVSPEGRHIATGSWTGEMIVWDADDLRPAWRSESHTNMINGFSFAPDGKRVVVSCSDDRSIKVWSTERGELANTLAGDDFVMSTCYSPTGRVLYSGGYDSVIRAWDTETWTVLISTPLGRATPP